MRHAAPTPLLSRRGAKLGSAALLATGSVGGTLLTTTLFADAASTYTVTSLADDGTTGTLRWAITQANADPGSTIVFAGGVTGTITLGSSLPAITASTTITGPGAASLTIDENGTNEVFVVDNGSTVVVSGFTLVNTDGANSAAVLHVHPGSNLSGRDLVIRDHHGVFPSGAGLVMCGAGTLSLSSTRISGFTSTNGLSLALNSFCDTTITDSAIVDNVAAAVFVDGYQLHITRTTISNNHSGVDIRNQGGVATITDSTISGNQYHAISGSLASHTTVANSTISGNGRSGGSVINAFDARMDLAQSTVTGNFGSETVRLDSSYFNGSARLSTNGSIVAGNAGPAVISSSFYSTYWSSASSIIGPTSKTINVDAGGNQLGISDPVLGPLADNGGPTLTHAILPGSPALDAGPATVPNFPGNEWDQRGTPFTRVFGTRVDVGAFEWQPGPAPSTTSTTTGGDPVVPKFTG